MKKLKNFQIAKVQPLVLLSFRLIFSQFQPGAAYESGACKSGAYSVTKLTVENKFYGKHLAYRKTGTRDPSGILVEPYNSRKTRTRDISGTLKKLGINYNSIPFKYAK